MIGLRSYFTSMRASWRFGRAIKLRNSGRKVEALALARDVLVFLRARHVVRENPVEASTLLSLILFVESLAFDLQERGADKIDLEFAAQALERFGDSTNDMIRRTRAEWLPHLRRRLESSDDT
jgi:hypothetical protein